MNPKVRQANRLTCWFSLTALMIQPLKILKGRLIENECLEALKTMESNKTPGMDGLHCTTGIL